MVMCKCFGAYKGKCIYYIFLMIIPSCKFIFINCVCACFDDLFIYLFNFAMGYLIGLSPKIYEISPSPSKNHIFYIVLHLHYFTQPCKTV
jgi:hypothetical protein